MEIDNPEIFSLTLMDLVNTAKVSVRLKNCINRAVADHNLPFNTVGEYLDRGEEARALLLKLPNLGNGTADELIGLISRLTSGYVLEVKNSQDAFIPDEVSQEILDLPLTELVNTFKVSVRLKNCIEQAAAINKLPFKTVGEFLNTKAKGRTLLLSIANLGAGTAEEFIELVSDLVVSKSREDVLPDLASTPAQKQLDKSNQFFALWEEGFSLQDIAELYDLSESTVRKYLKEHSEFELRPTPINLEKQKKRLEKSEQLLELYKQGLSYQEIGDKFNISRERVRQLLNLNSAFNTYLEEY
jgi:DNA-binding CsgD family transcriptional regulator